MKRGMLSFVALFLFSLSMFFPPVSEAVTYTSFSQTDIGSGILASATGTITSGTEVIGSTTYGTLDIVITNTSPLGPILTIGSTTGRANPFITELEYDIPTGFTMDESLSAARSYSTTWFANDIGNPATQLGAQDLYYNIVNADSSGMKKCFMGSGGTLEADNIRNDNAIGSINVLDGSHIPQEAHAAGFLKPSPNSDSGAVFDAVLFHFVFQETDTSALESFYSNSAQASLIVKFVGGQDYSHKHVANVVPEPASLLLLGSGLLGLLGLRKKIK